MDRLPRLALTALTLVLVVAPLAAVRPGLPPTPKADEPAYFAMALSLAHDGDLAVEDADVRRLFDEFPYLPIHNLILMSDDGWQEVHYGKPYLYSLLAAPAARLFGASGVVAFNMALLAAMIWMGAAYLGRYNPPGRAALFSALFILLSPVWVYAFWLQPELLMMFSGAACLFLAFRPKAAGGEPAPGSGLAAPRRGRAGILAAAGSGAALALGIYHKPVLLALALPALWALWRRRGGRAVVAWVVALGLVLGLLAGLAILWTGHPTAYLGAARAGVLLEGPADLEAALDEVRLEMALEVRRKNAWTWIFRPPDLDTRELVENLRYFFIGRHAGLVPYAPFAVLAVLLFLGHERRSAARWLLLAAFAAIALFYLIWIPINWHGGGGFVGNRYFLIVYPAFLFLATRLTPAWSLPVTAGAAALLLGPLLLTPYGAPVPEPTLQAHVRSAVLRHLPLELTVRKRIPSYATAGYGKVLVVGRRDVFQPPGEDHDRTWIHGATPVELLLLSDRQLEGLYFEITSPLADNAVTVSLPGDRRVVRFDGAHGAAQRRRTVELKPSGPSRATWSKPVRFKRGKRQWVYRILIETESGRPVEMRRPRAGLPRFYLGATFDYLGARHQLQRAEHYQVGWLAAEAPARVEPAALFTVRVRVENRSASAWVSRPPLAVNLGYRWLDAEGSPVETEARRSRFREEVAPGASAELDVSVRAPDRPGRYRLELDLVREHVAWFSRRGGQSQQVQITVAPVPEP